MVNSLSHWLRILFGASSQITLRGLSRFRGIGFRIPLWGFAGYGVPPGLVVPAHPLPVTVFRLPGFICLFMLLLHILASLFYGAILGGVLWHNLLGCSFPLPRICGNALVLFCLWPNKISCQWLDIFTPPLHWQCCLLLYCPLLPMFVVVSGPFLLGPFSSLFISGSFQIILPLLFLWLIPSHYSSFWIIRVLEFFGGALIVLMCWILVLGGNIHQLWFVTLVLKCRMHQNKYGESFRFLCILLLHLDVPHCNLKFDLLVLRFQFSDWSTPLPVSSVPSEW